MVKMIFGDGSVGGGGVYCARVHNNEVLSLFSHSHAHSVCQS